MKIVKPSIEIMTKLEGERVLQFLEECGRTCYQSLDRISEGSAEGFIRSIINRGHEAVLEHFNITVRFVCNRGVSHEIVRHRLASYCQESTRYCNYSKDGFGGEISVIEPCFLEKTGEAYAAWEEGCKAAEKAYFELLNLGCTAQEARDVLPNALKTSLVMTANIREWRHFLKLRCSSVAHPQMREIARMLLKELQKNIPVCFDDINMVS